MTLQIKLIAGLSALLILVAAFGLGFHKGALSEKKDCKLDAATSNLEGRVRQDDIAKDVKRLDATERNAARAHWMRD